MPWGTVAVQKGKECHSLIEDIEIPAADSALGARFYKILLFRLLITKAALIFGSKFSPLDLLMTKKSVDWWHQKYWMQ